MSYENLEVGVYSTESEIEISDSSDNCSICMAPFQDVTGVTFTNLRQPVYVCSHNFCQICLVSWLKKNDNCPLCRRSTIFNANAVN